MGFTSLASSQLELEQTGHRLDHHHSRSQASPVRELTFLIPVISPSFVSGALTVLRGYTVTDGSSTLRHLIFINVSIVYTS